MSNVKMAKQLLSKYLKEMATLYDSVSIFFDEDDWKKMPFDEQVKYGCLYYIYTECNKLGIEVVPPDFMTLNARNAEEKKEKEDIIKKDVFRCEFCMAPFVDREVRKKHRRYCKKRFSVKHEFTKTFKCDKCYYSSYSLGYLTTHRRIHFQEKSYKCNQCDAKYKTSLSLKVHIEAKHLNLEKQFACDKCSYKTHRKGELTRHKQTHEKIKRLICEICQRGFSRKRNLDMHMQQHTGFSSNTHLFQCEICEKKFASKNNLAKHVKCVHAKVKDFKCSQCDYETGSKYNFDYHVMRHTEELRCAECDYKTKIKNHFKHHMMKKHAI